MTKLSERLRPEVEAAPWVIEEVRKLEDEIERLREEAANKAEYFAERNSARDAWRRAADERDRLRSEVQSLDSGWSICSQACAQVQGERDKARAEIERLRAERDSFYMDYRMKCDEETKQQAAEIERLCADAERYRYVRRDPTMLLHLRNSEFDAAIDAAMKGEK